MALAVSCAFSAAAEEPCAFGWAVHLPNSNPRRLTEGTPLKLWIVNLVNVDGPKARQLVRVERDEDVADQPCLIAGEANRQSRLTILGQNGASPAIHVRDFPLAALPPEVRFAERAKHVHAFEDLGGGDSLAAGVRRQTDVRRH